MTSVLHLRVLIANERRTPASSQSGVDEARNRGYYCRRGLVDRPDEPHVGRGLRILSIPSPRGAAWT